MCQGGRTALRLGIVDNGLCSYQLPLFIQQLIFHVNTVQKNLKEPAIARNDWPGWVSIIFIEH